MVVDVLGGLFVIVSVDWRVFVWDIEGGFCIYVFKGYIGVVLCV